MSVFDFQITDFYLFNTNTQNNFQAKTSMN